MRGMDEGEANSMKNNKKAGARDKTDGRMRERGKGRRRNGEKERKRE